MRRLEAEKIRDAMLAVSGQLELTMSGEPLSADYAHDSGTTIRDRPKSPLDGTRRHRAHKASARQRLTRF
jgi:hypothetical protein